MALQDDYVKTALRLPKDLHADLLAVAARTGQSLNSAMVERLQAKPQDTSALVEAIARLNVTLADKDVQLHVATGQIGALASALAACVASLKQFPIESIHPRVAEKLDDFADLAQAHWVEPVAWSDAAKARFAEHKNALEKLSELAASQTAASQGATATESPASPDDRPSKKLPLGRRIRRP